MQLSVTGTVVQSNLPLLGSECEICVEKTAANTVYLHTSIQNLLANFSQALCSFSDLYR